MRFSHATKIRFVEQVTHFIIQDIILLTITNLYNRLQHIQKTVNAIVEDVLIFIKKLSL